VASENGKSELQTLTRELDAFVGLPGNEALGFEDFESVCYAAGRDAEYFGDITSPCGSVSQFEIIDGFQVHFRRNDEFMAQLALPSSNFVSLIQK
jgi:hypothetical protein